METKIIEKREIRYKIYNQDIVVHLPIRLDKVIKENVLARVVNEVVERIDMAALSKYYTGIGRPAYHPKLLIKVWVYGFCNKIYTSRPLSKKIKEDLCFIWLAGGEQPSFKTLCEFRGSRMEGMIESIFKEVLVYLVEHDYIDLNDLYVDGSKWEANAYKYGITWRKNVERYKQGVEERIEGLLNQISQLQQIEDADYGLKDLKCCVKEEEINLSLSSSDLLQTIQQVNELVGQQSDKQKTKVLKSLSTKLEKEQEKLKKYEEQEEILGTRNSFSKTDKDATGMRMKDDTLKPGYNPQITTSNQYIVNATVHQNASDSVTFPNHVEVMESRVAGIVASDWHPDWTTDAGYGSEENYKLLEEKKMGAFIKYPSWYAEQSGKITGKEYNKYNWTYEEQGDYFVCPQGRKLPFLENSERINKNGFKQTFKVYECESCQGCPVFKACRGEKASEQTNRRVRVNENLEKHKLKAKEKLASEKGIEKRSKRGTQVETPFGDIKYNMGHRRFILRGLVKVNIEFLLLAIAHNLRKVYCEMTGIWKNYYVQRAAKRAKKRKKDQK